MPTVERFKDLRVWQEARQVVKLVYGLTAQFPPGERYGLASQIQRAAVSTMSNVAEGFERGTNKEFIGFLYIAKGSNGEVRSQAYAALDLGYISQAECRDLVQQLREPGPAWDIIEPET